MKIQEARNVTRDCSAHRYGPAPTSLELAALTMAAVLDEVEWALDHPHHGLDMADQIRSIVSGVRP